MSKLENPSNQKYYLATTVFDLENIIKIKRYSGSLILPLMPAQDLMWHSPRSMVAAYLCYPTGRGKSSRIRNHYDSV